MHKCIFCGCYFAIIETSPLPLSPVRVIILLDAFVKSEYPVFMGCPLLVRKWLQRCKIGVTIHA